MFSEDRISETKDKIRDRLKHVCSHLNEDDFEKLVHKIALNDLRVPTTGVSRFDFSRMKDDE